MEVGAHIVSFARTLDAFAFEDHLRAVDGLGRIIPLPTGIAATCGLAWKLPPGARVQLDAGSAGLAWAGVHRYDAGGYVAVDPADVLVTGPEPDAALPVPAPPGNPEPGGAEAAPAASGSGGRLAAALGLPAAAPGRPLVLTAVGGGGKTTLVHALADEYAAAGLRVLLTTTTNMFLERGMALDPDAARAALAPGRVVVAGRAIPDAKFGGFDAAELDALAAAADVVLIEGDGAKRLPIKVPAAHEPSVPAATDHLLIVAGLSALGRPLGEACFRAAAAAELLGDPDAAARVLDADLVAALLRVGYLELPRLASWVGRRTVVLSQARPELAAAGGRVAALLPGERVVPWWVRTAPPAPPANGLGGVPGQAPAPDPHPGDRP